MVCSLSRTARTCSRVSVDNRLAILTVVFASVMLCSCLDAGSRDPGEGSMNHATSAEHSQDSDDLSGHRSDGLG